MAVYDDQNKDTSTGRDFTPEELAKYEDELSDYYENDPSPSGVDRVEGDAKEDKHKSARETRAERDQAEDEDMTKRLGAHFGAALKKDMDDNGGDDAKPDDTGFYRPGGRKMGFKKGRGGGIGALIRNRGMVAAAGVGISGLVVGGFSLLSFLNIFQLEHLIKLVDAPTFARLNATYEGRSTAWVRSYVKLRLAEIEGDTGEQNNLFFRSNKVTADDPIRSWYRTLRTNKFEEKVFNKHGIKFTSVVVQEGDQISLRNALITVNDKEFGFDAASKYDQAFIDRIAAGDLNAMNQLGADFDRVVDVDFFQNDKEARQRVSKVVRDNTYFFQYIKRRHLRRDIRNMTGIRDWTFFEKKRGEIRDYKVKVQKKIIRKILPSNNTGRFIACILSFGPCTNSTDPNNPETHADGRSSGPNAPGDDRTQFNPDGTPKTDADGNVIPGKTNGNEIGQAFTGAIEELGKDSGGEVAESLNLTQSFIKFITQKLLTSVNIALKVIEVMDMVSSFLNNVPKLLQMIANQKKSVVMGIYATYHIASDQLRSGDIGDAAEVGALMNTTKNFAKSEGYTRLTNPEAITAAVADNKRQVAYAADASRNNCSDDYVPQPDDFHVYCDKYKLDDVGALNGLKEIQEGPLGQAAESYETIRGPTRIFSDLFDRVLGAVLSPLGGLIKKIPGVVGTIEDVAGWMGKKILEFGGTFMFDPTSIVSGQMWGNFFSVGAAATAETGARSSGGVKSTPETAQYMKRLVYESQEEHLATQTWKDRYFSLDNPKSLASNTLFAISNVSFKTNLTKIFSGQSLSETLTNLAFFKTSAAEISPTAIAEMGGVEMYDVHPQCMNLDPLTAPVADRTNADDMLGMQVDWKKLQSIDAFWVEVTKLAKDKGVDPKTIYNCEDLDRKIRGGLGADSGYTDDGGYDESTYTPGGGATPTPTTPGGLGNLQSHPQLGGPNANGYYQMPPEGPYIIYSSPERTCGSKMLVDMLYTSGVWWKTLYPDEPFYIGDLNASGHKSHRTGVDVDVATEFTTSEQFSSVERSIAYGKFLADLKVDGERIVKEIYYNVSAVQEAVNAHAANPNFMYDQPGHYDHFHIRLQDKYKGPVSEAC